MDIENLGASYRTDIAAAHQNLTQAAQRDVAGYQGRQALAAATGLVSSYTEFIEQAYAERANRPLRDANLEYARTVLKNEGTGILARLDVLQTQQRLGT